MTREVRPIDGFRSVVRGNSRLIASTAEVEALLAAGLGDPAGWIERLASRDESAGRGATARLRLETGTSIFLKQLRRGGLAGPLWRERFAGSRRLLENLSIPVEVARQGIPTPAPVALLLLPGPPGLFRGFLATEEIMGARNLTDCLGQAPTGEQDEVGVALDLVRRLHDAGVEHRDLNLGNLLIVRDGPDVSALIVDLDRARLHPGPLPFRLRQRALRRLERSHLRLFGELGQQRRRWFERYAGSDRVLLDRLLSGEAAGRLWLRLRS